ncbi:MAG: flagellar motor protein MotB [Tissierellia bacterium]|nr:flagellar motor protein MotB [Tissierellia bacterium]
MARKKKRDEGGGASWMETYSDMVTLLLTFFIMLYAMSTIDAQKYSAIVASFSKAMNPEAYYQQMEAEAAQEIVEHSYETEDEETDEIDALYTLLKQYIEENELSDQVEISKSEEYVFIRFSDSVTFRGYSDILEQKGKGVLDVLAEGLVLVDEYIEEVVIAGHTAKVEYDKTDIDRSLSTNRANVVLKYLEDKAVIDPAKYLAIGYGLYSPIADNSTPEGRAKNRRVEIYISRKGYPISYTKIIQDTINKDKANNKDVEYRRDYFIE